MTQLAAAKKARPKRLTKRQQAEVEKLYPMAKAIGRRWQHRDAEAMDRAHDFILGAIKTVRRYRNGRGSLHTFARQDGFVEMVRRNNLYSLVHLSQAEMRQADEATLERARCYGSVDIVAATSMPDDEDSDDESHRAVLEALRRLDARDAEIVERLYVHEESPADIARDMGVTLQCVHDRALYLASLLRNDRDLCRALGRVSFHDMVATVPSSMPPRAGGMRKAAEFLASYQGRGGVGVALLRLLAAGAMTCRDLCLAAPLPRCTISSWMPKLISAGLVKCSSGPAQQAYHLTAKGRRLLDGVRRMEEWDASREEAKVPC